MSRSTYYIFRARMPKNCWTCDGYTNCRCDVVTIRATKRSARVWWDKEVANDYEEYQDEVVWLRLDKDGNVLAPYERGDPRYWVSRLDYAYDEEEFGPAQWQMSDELENWFNFLRMQVVYPPPRLGHPLLASLLS